MLKRITPIVLVVVALLIASLVPTTVSATSHWSLIGTHPDAAAQPTARGKTLHELHGFRDRVYVGYGDYGENTGPIMHTPWDPGSNQFINEGQQDTEEVNNYQPIAGRLYSPSIDPAWRGDLELGSNESDYAALTEDRKWPDSNMVESYHIFDIRQRPDGSMIMSGSGPGCNLSCGIVWRSDNGGANWYVWHQTTRDASGVYGGDRCYGLAVYGNQVWADCTDNAKRWTGSEWVNDFTQYYGHKESVIFANTLVTPVRSGLYGYNGSERVLRSGTHRWVAVDGSFLYAVNLNGEVFRTSDLSSWTKVTTVPSGTTSFTVYKGVAYAGNGASELRSLVVDTTAPDTTAPTTSLTAPTDGSTVSGTVAVTADASDNVGVTKVEFFVDGALAGTDTTSPYSYSWDTTRIANGSHTLQSKAYDAAGNGPGTSAVSTVTVSNVVPVTLPFRMNSGAGSYTDPAGDTWQADQYSTGGNTYSTTSTISGTDKQPLYQTERWGMPGYDIPVKNGTYKLRLHFAEIYSGCFSVGCRVFSATAEGATLFSGYDIYANVGANTATIKDYTVTVNDGSLSLGFAATSNNPKLSALEILESDTTAPEAPTNLSATAVSGTQIDLKWTASTSTDVAKYYIYNADSGAVIGESTNTSYSHTNLTAGTTYSYYVKAVDTAGNVSAASNTASATTPQPTDTTAPTTSLTAPAEGATVSGTVAVTADASDNVGVTKVEFYVNGALAGTDTTSPYSYDWDTTLIANGSHTLQSKAYDAAGNGPGTSAVRTVTVSNVATVSLPFRTNSGGASYTDPAGITWKADQYSVGGGVYSTTAAIEGTDKDTLYQSERWGMTGYEIPVKNGTYTLRLHFAEIYAGCTGCRVFSVSAEGQPLLTDYDIYSQVGANTADVEVFTVTVGDGTLNLGFTATVDNPKLSGLELLEADGDTTAPSAPTNLAASAVSTTQINLSWTASTDNTGGTGVKGYNILRNGVQIGTSTTTSYGDTTVSPGTAYTYTVTAYDGANPPNVSATSNSVSATTSPAAPTNLRSTGTGSSYVDLAWDASNPATGVSGYEIYRDNVLIATVTGTTYRASSLKSNTTYSFYVRAVGPNGTKSAPSNTLQVKTKSCLLIC